MHDAQRTMHDNGWDGEFLLVYLTRREVRAAARLLRWQLRRVAADCVNLGDTATELPPGLERDSYSAALADLGREADCLMVTLRELRAAWNRPSVVRDS